MKIAIPVHQGFVDEHFGHAERYIIYEISEGNQILNSTYVDANQGCGCRSGIAAILADRGVTVMLAGNIGGGAIQHLYNSGITVVRGCSGPAEAVLTAYLQGNIVDNNQTCHQHEGCEHEG